MAVELRCPDCRAKLRLKAAPEAGTEVECPKCGTVFPAPEVEPDEDAPKKKAADEGDEKPAAEKKEKKVKTKKGKGAADPNVPRKRRAKKKETSKAALIGVISAAVLMLLCMTATLIWYFSRTSKAVEMCYYVPEDAQFAVGINIGHAQKYPEFYKNVSSLLNGSDFKTAGDAIGKASGNTDLDGLADYLLKAESAKNGWAIVYRTKAEFDGGDLAKIPGAEKRSADGKTYYSVPNLLPGGQRGLAFAPTNRLVVVAPATMDNQPAFKKMLNGHGDSKDKTLGVRMGELGKRVTRGTFWQMIVFDNGVGVDAALPPANTQGGQAAGEDNKAKKRTFFSDALGGTQGIGVKASLGSREVRFELIAWHKEAEKASNFAKKMKESELGKGDEGTPPTWFKEDTAGLGDRKIAAQLLSNISFGSSGDLFYVRSSVETVDLQGAASNIMGKVTGMSARQGGGGPGGMGPAPGGPMPGGPPGAPGPKMRRPGRVRARR